MPTLPRHTGVAVFAAVAIGAGILLGIAGWLEPARPAEFAGLILTAVLISAFTTPQSVGAERATMRPSFVIEFTSLLLFGPGPTMVVAVSGAVAQALVDSARPYPYRRTLLNAITVIVATQAAGLAHQVLGGTRGKRRWPAQGVPIAAGVVAYYVVKGVRSK